MTGMAPAFLMATAPHPYPSVDHAALQGCAGGDEQLSVSRAAGHGAGSPTSFSIGPILRPNASESPRGDETMKRKAVWALGFDSCGDDVRWRGLDRAVERRQALKDGEALPRAVEQDLYNGGQAMQISANLEVVAHDALGDRGFNGDVWSVEGYAYVGHWGPRTGRTDRGRIPGRSGERRGRRQDRRLSNGQVSTLQNPVGTSAEDVVVYTARDGRDIAVAGIQWCGGSREDTVADRGALLWDVTESRLGSARLPWDGAARAASTS